MPQYQPLSIYIPRVFGNIDAKFIKSIFEKLNLGRVRRVDLVPRENPETRDELERLRNENSTTNMAFVHFWEWSDSAVSFNFQEKVLDPSREARVVYDDPWYWIVLENRNPKSDAEIISEDKLRMAEQYILELEARISRLEFEIYSGDDIPEGYKVVSDDEGNEYIIEALVEDSLDPMPQRQNGEGGAEADPRRPIREPGVSLGEQYDQSLENQAYLEKMENMTSMMKSLSIENNTLEPPEWLDVAAISSTSPSPSTNGATKTSRLLSRCRAATIAQHLQEELEDCGGDGEAAKLPTPPSISLPLCEGQIRRDTRCRVATIAQHLQEELEGGDGFVSKHPTECPSISLPLCEGQIRRDTVTGNYFIYNNVDGDHIWNPIQIDNLNE